MNNKKTYQSPQTITIIVEPLSILCASRIYIDSNPGDDLVGG